METVEQTRLRIEEFVKEKAPQIDISPGSVFSELLTGLQAQAQNEVYNQIANIEAAKTVKDVLASATDTFSETIDRLASNYSTYRNEGKKANGQLKVWVSKGKTYYLPEGTRFVQPNLNFEYVTVTNYTISSATSPVQLKQEGTSFYFVIPVEAVDIGKDKQVAHGTKFAISNSSYLPEFVDAEAYGAFTQGEDKETDKELITRFQLGLSVKNLISPNAIDTVLKDKYPNFRLAAVRGIGDPEEIRGSNNPFGIVLPGMVDVYVRMSYALSTVVITLPGNRIMSGPDEGQWQLDIPADAVPGFYKVVSIVKHQSNEAGTQTFHNIAYGYDTSLYEKKNNINSVQEARFSKYQTCSLRFGYGSTDPTDQFDVTFLYQPQLADIQAEFLNNAERVPCADYLVKAIVPCNVSVNVKLVKNNSLDSIDVASIKSDIFNYINGLPIGESVSASRIVDICHNYGIKRVDLPVVMKGSIFVPYSLTDEVIYISGTDTLDIPNLPDKGVTPYTTSFFVNYTDENGLDQIGVEAA